jgi:predicted dehydrogenase
MMSLAAMEAGKDVLCEKPLSRTEDEARAMIETANRAGRILKCGFNHRFHPAVLEAHRLFSAGQIGRPVFGRARYGIAGREGIEMEWRSDPKIVSGGQLMEQGIHLVDLFRWFLGDMSRVTGMTAASHWPMPPPLEDNGFLIMQNQSGVICSIHSSLTQWINLFEFEVYGTHGSLTVHGLGTSYGVEKLTISEHDPKGPFASKTIEYRGGDSSWKSEWMEFTLAVAKRSQPVGNGEDGLKAMQIVNAAYAASRDGRTVHLDN